MRVAPWAESSQFEGLCTDMQIFFSSSPSSSGVQRNSASSTPGKRLTIGMTTGSVLIELA